MDLNIPNKPGVFTLLTKTGCNDCVRLKRILELNDMEYETVDCDEYLQADRDEFIKSIKLIINDNDVERVFFPIVFYEGGYVKRHYEFIGKLYSLKNI
jgi:glutaredoxin